MFSFPSLEESDDLETDIREFLRAIYFVLESKRVDVSFEKLVSLFLHFIFCTLFNTFKNNLHIPAVFKEFQDSPYCPVLPEEERYRIGLENKSSKTYKYVSSGKCVLLHVSGAKV